MSNYNINNNKAYYNMIENNKNKQNNNIMNPNYNNDYQDINNFKNENILQKTKNSVGDLIKYNDEFKNSAQYPGEEIDEIKIKQLLLPVYDKIYEIREDLQKFSDLSKKNNDKNLSTRQFNEMHSLHTNMLYNKNLIDDTLNYMKEKIENVHYEQIHKEFEDISSMLETLNIEMENMVNEFNNKYEKIIKEKKRQKIAEDLLNGNYNKKPEMNKYDLLNKNDDLKIHKNIDDEDDIDYNQYKSDINELNIEKENLMLKYLEDKQKAINGLPKLVPPNEKVSFKYEIKPPNYGNVESGLNNNKINEINNSNNSINKKGKVLDNENNNIINDNNNSINNNINDIININDRNNISNSNNKIKKQPKEKNSIIKNNNLYNNNNGLNKPNGSSKNINKRKKSFNYMENGDNNNQNKDLTETMNDFQKKMNLMSNQIITGNPRKNYKPKIISSGPTKADYMRNIQPRSNASKVTFQNFKIQKKPEPYIFDNKYKKKPNKFKVGKYPNEDDGRKLNEFIEQNPQKTILKKEPNYIDPNLLEMQIKKIVDINIKKALSLHGLESQKNKNDNNNNDELLKILIQKFDDIENAIRETKNINDNGAQFQPDINEMLANEIFNKIYSQLNSNIKININNEKSEEEEEEPQPEPKKNKNIQKSEEIPININVFEDNKQIGIDELEKIIPNPRDILKKYDENSSNTCSCIGDISLKDDNNLKKPDISLEINKINIKENRFINENNINLNNNNIIENQIDNSISKGEVRSDYSEEDIKIEKNKYFRTDNNFYNKNKTGNDLLFIKNYNENLPDNYYYNNLQNINNNNNNLEEEDESLKNKYYNKMNNYNSNININNNKFKININNNKDLEKNNFYEKEEYDNFKNNFLEKMNNNKTQSNFANISNPNFINTYNQFRPIQNNQNFNNTMGSLKLNKNFKESNEELNKKLQLLKIKNKQISEELGIPGNEENNISPNINNLIIQNNNIKKSMDSGEYSPGEVRSDTSF